MNLKVNYKEHAFVPVYHNLLIINQEVLTRYNICIKCCFFLILSVICISFCYLDFIQLSFVLQFKKNCDRAYRYVAR